MIALRIDFLAGRFHATPWSRGVNDGDIEWPPEPWRILRALVAASFLGEKVDRSLLLRVLDKLAEPPAYHLPPSGQGHTRHYMPVVEGGAEKRVLILDSFIALDRGRGRVTSAFAIYAQAVLAEEERLLLQSLVARIGYLGRAESWCEVTLCGDPPLPNVDVASNKPGSGATVRRLTAGDDLRGTGLFASLCQTNAAMRKAKRLLPPGTEWIDYRFDAAYGQEHAAKARQTVAAFGPAILRFGLEGSENNLLPSRYDTLVVGEAMRAAAMSRYSALHAGVVTGALSGKSSEGTKAIGQSHAFYLPQDTKNAGATDAIDVWLPAGCTHEEFRALSAITRLYYRLSSSEHPEFALTFLGVIEPTIARVWESTTPLVLDRFPKADALPADQVRIALERRGLEPESIDVWTPRRHVELRGGRHLRLDAFRKTRLRKDGVLPPMIGATVRFQTPVAGPVVLGRLAHFGLGQFRPSEL